MRVTMAAPAKVNLALRVGPPGPDGYHPIATLFCALKLADTVVVRPDGDGPRLEVAAVAPLASPPDLGPPAANLAVRAAEAFEERAGLDGRTRIRLTKRIPAGGGLGGGSSDAAAVLRALRRLHPEGVDGPELLELAAGLGSDVPFFVLGVPLAGGVGRGEELAPVDTLPPRPVVLVIPPYPIATADAYRWLDEDRRAPEPPDPAVADPVQGWDDVAARAVNDFEGPVFRRHPDLGRVRDALRSSGARVALLAGSGSTLFGVYDDRSTAAAAAERLRTVDPRYTVLLTATRAR